MKNYARVFPFFIFTLVIALCMMFFPVVFASSAVPVPVPPSSGGLNLPPFVWELIWGGVALVGGWALTSLRTVLKKRADSLENEVWRGYLGIAAELASITVDKLFQTTVGELKAGSKDGNLAPDEGPAAFKIGLEDTWAALPPLVKAAFEKAAGSSDAAKKNYLEPLIEQAVGAQKTPPLISTQSIVVSTPALIPEPIPVHPTPNRLPPISGPHTPEQTERIQSARAAARERARVRLGLPAKAI